MPPPNNIHDLIPTYLYIYITWFVFLAGVTQGPVLPPNNIHDLIPMYLYIYTTWFVFLAGVTQGPVLPPTLHAAMIVLHRAPAVGSQ